MAGRRDREDDGGRARAAVEEPAVGVPARDRAEVRERAKARAEAERAAEAEREAREAAERAEKRAEEAGEAAGEAAATEERTKTLDDIIRELENIASNVEGARTRATIRAGRSIPATKGAIDVIYSFVAKVSNLKTYDNFSINDQRVISALERIHVAINQALIAFANHAKEIIDSEDEDTRRKERIAILVRQEIKNARTAAAEVFAEGTLAEGVTALEEALGGQRALAERTAVERAREAVARANAAVERARIAGGEAARIAAAVEAARIVAAVEAAERARTAAGEAAKRAERAEPGAGEAAAIGAEAAAARAEAAARTAEEAGEAARVRAATGAEEAGTAAAAEAGGELLTQQQKQIKDALTENPPAAGAGTAAAEGAAEGAGEQSVINALARLGTVQGIQGITQQITGMVGNIVEELRQNELAINTANILGKLITKAGSVGNEAIVNTVLLLRNVLVLDNGDDNASLESIVLLTASIQLIKLLYVSDDFISLISKLYGIKFIDDSFGRNIIDDLISEVNRMAYRASNGVYRPFERLSVEDKFDFILASLKTNIVITERAVSATNQSGETTGMGVVSERTLINKSWTSITYDRIIKSVGKNNILRRLVDNLTNFFTRPSDKNHDKLQKVYICYIILHIKELIARAKTELNFFTKALLARKNRLAGTPDASYNFTITNNELFYCILLNSLPDSPFRIHVRTTLAQDSAKFFGDRTTQPSGEPRTGMIIEADSGVDGNPAGPIITAREELINTFITSNLDDIIGAGEKGCHITKHLLENIDGVIRVGFTKKPGMTREERRAALNKPLSHNEAISASQVPWQDSQGEDEEDEDFGNPPDQGGRGKHKRRKPRSTRSKNKRKPRNTRGKKSKSKPSKKSRKRRKRKSRKQGKRQLAH